jgi:hypothetical protein
MRGFEKTRQLMGALVRMPPKQHEQMKVGKKQKTFKKTVRKDASAKPKTA